MKFKLFALLTVALTVVPLAKSQKVDYTRVDVFLEQISQPDDFISPMSTGAIDPQSLNQRLLREGLLRKLESLEDPPVVMIKLLGEFSDDRVKDQLFRVMNDTGTEFVTRKVAYQSLGRIADKGDVGRLKEILKSADPIATAGSLFCLGRIGDQESREAIEHFLTINYGKEEFIISLEEGLHALGWIADLKSQKTVSLFVDNNEAKLSSASKLANYRINMINSRNAVEKLRKHLNIEPHSSWAREKLGLD